MGEVGRALRARPARATERAGHHSKTMHPRSRDAALEKALDECVPAGYGDARFVPLESELTLIGPGEPGRMETYAEAEDEESGAEAVQTDLQG